MSALGINEFFVNVGSVCNSLGGIALFGGVCSLIYLGYCIVKQPDEDSILVQIGNGLKLKYWSLVGLPIGAIFIFLGFKLTEIGTRLG